MASKTPCSDQNFISIVEECKHAAQILSIPYGESGEWRALKDFGGCQVAWDGRNKNTIYFNTAIDLTPTLEAMIYHAICSSEINTDTNKGEVVPILTFHPICKK